MGTRRGNITAAIAAKLQDTSETRFTKMASKNVDKRTFRKENAFEFMRAASKWRESMKPIAAPSKTLIQDSSVKICVRKRPIFEHELKQGEFDMLTCNGNFHVIVHDGRMHPDCKHAFINHITFP